MKTGDFQAVYRAGRSRADRYLVVYVLPNGTAENRLGISVSRKVGNSVTRHRIIRLIRESYRLSAGRFKKGYDIVVIARAGVKGQSFRTVERSLLRLGEFHRVVDQ